MFWLEQFFYLTWLDALVLFGALAGFLSAPFLLKANRRHHWSRHQYVKLVIYLCLLPLALAFYAFFIEPNLLTVKEISFDAPNIQLEQPLRLVVIGDMQARATIAPSYVKFVTNEVNQLGADYIFWVGDLVEGEEKELPLFEPFGQMRARIGKFAVLGNHDYRDDMDDPMNQLMAQAVAADLEHLGFTTLRNQAVVTQAEGHRVVVAGTEDLWSGRVDFPSLNQQVEELSGETNLLITHQPQTVTLNQQSERYSLVMAGHCHGGQINLLWFNPLFGLPRLPPGCSHNPQHVSGLFEEWGHQIFVTPGVGSLHLRPRFFSPPQISVIKFF